MAYKLDKTGDLVRDDLNAVEQKSIYPMATTHEDGIMSKQHVSRINTLEQEVDENNECLTDFEIRMICMY